MERIILPKQNRRLIAVSAYKAWQRSSKPLDEKSHQYYRNIMCLKETTCGPKKIDKDSLHLSKSEKLQGRSVLKHLCVLPKGHMGKCHHKFDTQTIFNKSVLTKKILVKIHFGIYQVPGNDDYVYKNRASRLSANVLSKKEELKIRDKKVKKHCAIPLKAATTPLLLAQAALDWMTYLFSVPGLRKAALNGEYEAYFRQHKGFLIDYYKKFNREIFNDEGATICAVTGNPLCMDDVVDLERDVRKNPHDNDLQVGHNHPSNDRSITIRGCNLLPMSRRGNLIIGEKIFTENKWIEELKKITQRY